MSLDRQRQISALPLVVPSRKQISSEMIVKVSCVLGPMRHPFRGNTLPLHAVSLLEVSRMELQWFPSSLHKYMLKEMWGFLLFLGN